MLCESAANLLQQCVPVVSCSRLFNMEVQMEKSHVTQTTAESEGEEKNKPSREVAEGSTSPHNESVVLGQTWLENASFCLYQMYCIKLEFCASTHLQKAIY